VGQASAAAKASTADMLALEKLKEAGATATLSSTVAETEASNPDLDDSAASMWPALYMLDAYVRQFAGAARPAP
jgi:hypothetical protein